MREKLRLAVLDLDYLASIMRAQAFWMAIKNHEGDADGVSMGSAV